MENDHISGHPRGKVMGCSQETSLATVTCEGWAVSTRTCNHWGPDESGCFRLGCTGKGWGREGLGGFRWEWEGFGVWGRRAGVLSPCDERHCRVGGVWWFVEICVLCMDRLPFSLRDFCKVIYGSHALLDVSLVSLQLDCAVIGPMEAGSVCAAAWPIRYHLACSWEVWEQASSTLDSAEQL